MSFSFLNKLFSRRRAQETLEENSEEVIENRVYWIEKKIIIDAVRRRATEIRLERRKEISEESVREEAPGDEQARQLVEIVQPMEEKKSEEGDDLVVRYRIAGKLHDVKILPAQDWEIRDAVVSRIKTVAKQGTFRFTEADMLIEATFQVSVLPTAGGEKVVIQVAVEDSPAPPSQR